MPSKTIQTTVLAVLVFLGFVEAAWAYYSPRLGRFLNRDPISEPAFVLAQRTAANGLPSWSRFAPRDSIASAANQYTAMNNAPTDFIDPDGREPCKRETFPGVVVQRFTSAVGHQWLVVDGARRGFYPEGENSVPFVVPGKWIGEGIMIAVEEPLGSGHIERVDRIDYAIAHDWFDEWNTRRRCTGKLQDGSGKGTYCSCASRGQIIDCLLKRTSPGTTGTYCLVGGNCTDRSESALVDCCLRKHQRTHHGKPFGSTVNGSSDK